MTPPLGPPNMAASRPPRWSGQGRSHPNPLRNIALVIVAGLFGAVPGLAQGAGCPGASVCPYAGVSVIGQRAEGVFRFPQAVAIGPAGDVYVGDQQ
ncbi:MAG: tripartite motif-containing protein 71, partial [Solirubrobacteraceae bacterium]|nr:tripartite motif-containing protein 71 [Solirubrobacteraceae bacterium]MEA2354762.1 tripartite motif-containing protein 71 [Solirubrobacteraceae bacterium]